MGNINVNVSEAAHNAFKRYQYEIGAGNQHEAMNKLLLELSEKQMAADNEKSKSN